MLARRFALPPINEAHYDPRGVPSADRQMTNTTIVRPTREQWLAMLGELVLHPLATWRTKGWGGGEEESKDQVLHQRQSK